MINVYAIRKNNAVGKFVYSTLTVDGSTYVFVNTENFLTYKSEYTCRRDMTKRHISPELYSVVVLSLKEKGKKKKKVSNSTAKKEAK